MIKKVTFALSCGFARRAQVQVGESKPRCERTEHMGALLWVGSWVESSLLCRNHLDLTFVYGDRYGCICIILHVVIQLDYHHLLKMLTHFHC